MMLLHLPQSIYQMMLMAHQIAPRVVVDVVEVYCMVEVHRVVVDVPEVHRVVVDMPEVHPVVRDMPEVTKFVLKHLLFLLKI